MLERDVLIAEFRRRYSDAGPIRVIEAPGRVDLLGSHNDYNGFPVLTITLDRAITLVAAPAGGGTVHVENVNPTFEPVRFELEPDIPRAAQGNWANYVKAAAQWLMNDGCAAAAPCGMVALVDSDLPMGAGLSSSSALVVGTALALIATNEAPLDRLRLAEETARAEHYVGTAGGGMDQACCLLGRAGSALRLDFFPLRARVEPVPPGFDFLIIDTLIRTAKTREHLDVFNRRVVECRLAAAVLAHRFDVEYDPDTTLLLGQLPPDLVDLAPDELEGMLREAFPCRTQTTAVLAEMLDCTADDVRRRWLMLPSGRVFPEPADGFRLLQRARHILGEALRVNAATECCANGDAEALPELIRRGYESSRDNYEVSLPEVDALLDCCRQAGVPAARLPGAGFGGALIGVAAAGTAEDVRRRLYETFYSRADPDRFPPDGDPERQLRKTCFQVVPSAGAEITTV